jgi:Ni/Co efflux regulator RcnB
MKKLGLALAALTAIAIAAPSIASAETVVIRHGGGHHWDRSRAEMRGHRDWHPHHHHDRVVIVKHRH